MPRVALTMLLLLASASADGAPVDDMIRKARYGLLSISPSGDHVSMTVPMEDRTVLAILRLADMQVTATVDPGKNAFVDDAVWVSERRLLAQWSVRQGVRAQPYSGWSLYAVDVDGRNRNHFYGSLVDPLQHDPDHVLVRTCTKAGKDGCLTRLQKVGTGERSKTETIATAPVPDAQFLTDRVGAPRFSWGWDEEDIQKVYQFRNGKWVLVNDEGGSGVEVMPLGVSYDLRYGYLRSERTRGPDVIERIDLVSGERAVIAADPNRDPTAIVWSLDGSEPIGVSYGATIPAIAFFDKAHPHAALIADMEMAFPGEVARVISSTRDGRKAIVEVVSDREPGRHYLLDTATGDTRLLVESRPWFKPEAMAATEHTVVQARDGTPMDVYLTRPLKSKSAPLVVLVHGGPYGVRDAWFFDDEVQLLAAEGYAVLRVNFRGSGGRGRAYVESGFRQWGRAMQDDLTDATRWATTQTGIDPARTCIWGASYGGYAALMGVIREPGLYRCAIGMAGPYDLPTMYRWGDVQRSDWGKGQLNQFLGSDASELLERSPTRHASRIDVPLLLVQGGLDSRVSPEHAKAMVRALEKAGKSHETYFAPSEGHGFLTEKARREYYSRVISFLDRSLGVESP